MSYTNGGFTDKGSNDTEGQTTKGQKRDKG